MGSSDNLKEVNTVYWRGLFVPIVVSLLVLATIVVFITTNVGQPHSIIQKIQFGAPKTNISYG
jgi:hypothetical protein